MKRRYKKEYCFTFKCLIICFIKNIKFLCETEPRSVITRVQDLCSKELTVILQIHNTNKIQSACLKAYIPLSSDNTNGINID